MAAVAGRRHPQDGVRADPDAGSKCNHNVRFTARRDGDGWVISGQKYYISAIDQADAVLLIARDGDLSTEEKKKLSISWFPPTVRA